MTQPMVLFVRHPPDPVNMENYWTWFCECGDTSDREFASREDAEDDAEQHGCLPIIDVSPGAFMEIDPDDYRLPHEEKLGEDER